MRVFPTPCHLKERSSALRAEMFQWDELDRGTVAANQDNLCHLHAGHDDDDNEVDRGIAANQDNLCDM